MVEQQSDLKKAADNINPSELTSNLNKDSSQIEQPQDLDKKEQTPFIDDSLRTDK